MEKLNQETFEQLPLVAEGNSKIVRYLGDGNVAIKLKPTVYSFTHNRAGEIEGTDDTRRRASEALVKVIRPTVRHAYQKTVGEFIIADLVIPENTGELFQPFVPHDLSPEKYAKLRRATPIETVVKRYHTGTPKHRYYGMTGTTARLGHFRGSMQPIKTDEKYPELVVRFDWRNPLQDARGNRLADEVLPDQMANWYIDVERTRFNAHLAFTKLERHLKDAGLELWDMCFFFTEDGEMIFSEISPDCMRVKALDGSGSVDKDLWRSGNSSATVAERWKLFADIVESKV